MRRGLLLGLWLGLAVAATAATRIELTWPTPHPAWTDGQGDEHWLQHAGSGNAESGGYGGVRSSGTQFHEGIDIQPVARDSRGVPTDVVMAAMSGVVRHVSTTPGNSSYGRYVVLEHPNETPALYTLYAHLARVEAGLRPGDAVARGQTIGVMGHSAGGYSIPRSRAHLHFEMGLMVTRDFQAWYDRQGYSSRNVHGNWNGMNLMGIDPLAFFNEWRAGRLETAADYFKGMETAVKVRIAARRMPDFVARYPALVTKPLPMGLVPGWEISFHWTGLPFAWTPLTGQEVLGFPLDEPRIVDVNVPINWQQRSKSLAVSRRGAWVIGKDLATVLQQLFALPKPR